MYTNYSNSYPERNSSYSTYYGTYPNPNEERFFLAPFLMGGLAGTALGYGIANNNQINQQPYYPMVPMVPIYYSTYPSFPTYSNSNNYYY